MLFGTASGLSGERSQLLGTSDTLDWSGNSGYLGREMVVGDFDGDSFDDLILNGSNDHDVPRVVVGSPDGLDRESSLLLSGDAETRLAAFAVGDVDGDGLDDLVIGDPGPRLRVWIRGSGRAGGSRTRRD